MSRNGNDRANDGIMRRWDSYVGKSDLKALSHFVRVTDLTVGPKSHIADGLESTTFSTARSIRVSRLSFVVTIGIWLARVSAYVVSTFPTRQRTTLRSFGLACASIILGQERTPHTSEEYFERGLAPSLCRFLLQSSDRRRKH